MNISINEKFKLKLLLITAFAWFLNIYIGSRKESFLFTNSQLK